MSIAERARAGLLVCRYCQGAVTPERGNGPGGWRYYCKTEGCYGVWMGWPSWRLWLSAAAVKGQGVA